jgi:glutathione S-transferase
LSRTLYHWRLDPFSRQVRLALAEKGVATRLKEERVWDGRQDFLALNPAGATPVLVLEPAARKIVIVGARALLEYLEETEPAPALLPRHPALRAEARRLADWFDRKFDAEVNGTILHEKIDKLMTGGGPPSVAAIREGRTALRAHLAYVARLVDERPWLAGDQMTIADLAGAAHLSCVDYFGEVDWDGYPPAKAWYQKLKSRPSFRPLLADTLVGVPPAPIYAALDF